MTDDQLRRLQQAAAEAAVEDDSNIVYLPHVRQMTEAIERSAPVRDDRIEAIGEAPAEVTVKCGIEAALDWYRAHPGSDHLDSAFAAYSAYGRQLDYTRWPEFVAAVKDVTEAASAFRAAGMEAER
jgi:hypothetical protein